MPDVEIPAAVRVTSSQCRMTLQPTISFLPHQEGGILWIPTTLKNQGTLSLQSPPKMDVERLKSSHTTYPYPAVDDTDQDLDRRPEAEKREWEHRLIQSMSTKPLLEASTLCH